MESSSHVGPAGEDEEAAPMGEDLKRRIIKQVEYYFSDENLPSDNHMIGLMKKNKEAFVPISAIASFRKIKKLATDNHSLAAALRASSFLVVSSDGKMVKRLNPFALRDSKLYTVLVENLPEDHSPPNIRKIFGEAGNIKNVSICDPHAIEETSKSNKGGKFISSNKLHALVEYETIEAAEKAVATFNNEQDWRSGLRVKLLKKAVKPKHGPKQQAWRVTHDSADKNHCNRLPDLSGEEGGHNTTEGNHNSSEHHDDDVTDGDNGAHLQKEKSEQRVRNRGRSGRQKNHSGGGANGIGHGTSRCSGHHQHEPPKPPPGPRMPDGTRGFAIGRGRPPTSDHA